MAINNPNVLIGVLAIILFFVSGCTQNEIECHDDVNCFESAARTCTPAHLTVNEQNYSIEHKIVGRFEGSGNCYYNIYTRDVSFDVYGKEAKGAGLGCEMNKEQEKNFKIFHRGDDTSPYGECNTLIRISD